MTTPNPPLSPYDTGARLEPQLWPVNDDPDRAGRVDFDDDEGATLLSAFAERLADGSHALHVELIAGEEDTAVYVDGVLYAPVAKPQADHSTTHEQAAMRQLMPLDPEVLGEAIARALARAGARPEWSNETIEHGTDYWPQIDTEPSAYVAPVADPQADNVQETR